MSASAQQANHLFESMLDDLLADITHAHGTPASKEHLAGEVLKLMVHSLRLGQPSQRMMDLLAKHLEGLKPESALPLLGVKKTGLGFRNQEAIDAFEQASEDGEDEHAARVAAYNVYFRDQGRSYASDLLDTDCSRDGNFENRAEAAMHQLVGVLRRGGVIKRNPRGRPPKTKLKGKANS